MNGKNKLLLTFLLVLFAGLLIIYGIDTLRIANESPRTIAVVLKTVDSRSEYWRTVREGMELAAKEYEVAIEITGPLTDTDAEGQMSMIDEALTRKPDAMIVGPVDPIKLESAVDRIREAKAKLVVIESPLAGRIDSLVGTNHADAGRLAAESLIDPRNANPLQVVTLRQTESTDAEKERQRGLEEAFSGMAEVDYLGAVDFDGTEEDAYERVKKLIRRYPDLQGVVGINEQATVGAAKALKELKNAGWIKLVSFGSSIYEIKLLEEGTLQATVVQKPFNIGYLSVETAVQALQGVKVSPRLSIEAHVITKDNLYTQGNQELLFPLVE